METLYTALNLPKLKCLLSSVSFLIQKSPEIVCRPGSAHTRWGSLQRSPRHSSWIKGLLLKIVERGKKGRKERGWEGTRREGLTPPE